MPMLDMPLSRLKEYNGISPKPDDFDAFWDEQLEKIHAYNGKVEISDYDCVKINGYKVQNMYFEMPDGSKIHARITRPDKNEKMPVLFRFHGKSGNIGSVNGDLSFAAAGFAVASMDCRSQTGKSDDATDRGLLGQEGLIVRGLCKGKEWLYYKDVFLDVVRLVDIVKAMDFCDTDRLFAHGGSQGGALGVICAALCPEIKAAYVLYPFLSDYKRLYEMDLMKDAYWELCAYIRAVCPAEGELRDKMWHDLGYIDIQNFAQRVKGEVCWHVGLMDQICPPSTQFACYNKLTSKKQINVYTNHGHEGEWRIDESVLKFLVERAF